MAKKYKTKNLYKTEILGEDDDDGTMVESKEKLAEAVVGHRIVSVEKSTVNKDKGGWRYPPLVITLDNGKRVEMAGVSDCCAFTEVEAFLLHPDKVDHIITGVGTTDGYDKWHIYADMGDVLELTVDWSCGNPFYYGYGFDIQVKDINE